MTRWRPRSRSASASLAAAGVAIAAGAVTFFVAGDDDGPDSEAVLPTTTAATPDRSTVVPAPLPDPCPTDPESLAVWTAGVRIDATSGAADAVIRFENLTAVTCDLDLTDPTVRLGGAESSVRLEPGGWGELLFGNRRSPCSPLAPLRSVVLELNGDARTVPTAAVIACEQAVVAFLPADRPADPCLARALTTAVIAAGLVVRNDGAAPCVLGDLISVTIPTGPAPSLIEIEQTRPGTAVDAPVGPDVTGLGQGDVAYFQTLGDPLADCTFTVQPARLDFTSVAVDGVFPNCTFVRVGPGHPYYGSPHGPLTDPEFADEFTPARNVWIAELDPFRSS